jgi:hypothetical protein
MTIYELKQWPKIWKIAEEAIKKQQKIYCEELLLSQAFTWSETDYRYLFRELNCRNISEAKSLYPELFNTEKIYELWKE